MSKVFIILEYVVALLVVLSCAGAVLRKCGPKVVKAERDSHDADHGTISPSRVVPPLSTYDRDKERADSRSA